MSMLNFAQPHHFLQSAGDSRALCAFALGAAEQSVYDHLKDERSEIPSSLARQEIIERIAQEKYGQYIKVAELKQTLKKHTETLLEESHWDFEDVKLHIQHPDLPLVKYYAAIMQTQGRVCRCTVWEQHYELCQMMSLAVYEQYQHPTAHVSYSKESVVVTHPKTRQCLCYGKLSAPTHYYSHGYHYIQLSLPVLNHSMIN